MLSFLKPGAPKPMVPTDQILSVYKSKRFWALLGVFLGYAAFYIVRNNFALSTPYLQQVLELSKSQIGSLTGSMLIAYGISKGVMSSMADKCSPRKFMVFGLVMCALMNILMGFAGSLTAFLILIVLNGFFQGFGVGPSFITIAKWYPKSKRGTVGAIWNISHNIGGGIIAPIVAAAFFFLSQEHWRIASYTVPACIALLVATVIYFLIKESPEREGLPPTSEITGEQNDKNDTTEQAKAAEGLSAGQIFYRYVFKNKNAWFISLVDTFVYLIRFGILTWIPIYLLQVKGFSKAEMAIAFLVFEWAAIPSTLFAGYISDKLFKGYRMPPAIISLLIIIFCIFGYWQSTTLTAVTIFAAIIGCLIYIPQFLASVQTMEIVPPFAVGSAVGLRGFMSYIVGASGGTSLYGLIVDRVGWDGGFYLLLSGAILCIIFCILAHRGAKQLKAELESTKHLEHYNH